MPVNFLTQSQRKRYGCYPEIVTNDEMARYFHLSDGDHEWIASKRKDVNRLGYALQLTTVRFLGTFIEDVSSAPPSVIAVLAKQLNVLDVACLAEYRHNEQHWRHMTEIRQRYGYREFVTVGIRFRLGRWLCALCWTGTDRPSLLFEYASGWLIAHKVLLPGATVLVGKAWHRYVTNNEGKSDPVAFTFGTLDMLKTALRRRDVFVMPSWRYADPCAGLLSGAEWITARPLICRALDISIEYQVSLSELAQELDQTYRAVAARLPNNTSVRIETIDGKDELILSPLDKLDEPTSLIALRKEVKARMPRVDLPEILLEISACTGFTDAFTHLTESTSRATDIVTSLCAVLLSQACNTGPEPFTRQDTPALRRDRLMWIDQNYVREETLIAANVILVAAQNKISLAQLWGGGDVASADGMRFVVPVRTVHAGPNSKYFHRGRGVTWYNLISDQRSGLNGITVPGTLRDSLVLLAVVLEQQTELQPTRIMTDTGAYSDIVFGLFRLLGYRFSPRLADIGGSRFWRIDRKADYGKLNGLARQCIILDRISPHWDDILRLIGSLKMGLVPATGIMRTLQVGDRPTRLAQAIAEIGRIDKTIHILNYIDDEARRRSTLLQLNLGEGRHSLARDIFHGKRGELHQRYREGQEDQLSALGLVVNIVVLWNTIYTDAILTQLRAEGYQVQDEDAARLSPFGHEHINMLGRYSFSVPDSVARGELRPFRTPTDP